MNSTYSITQTQSQFPALVRKAGQEGVIAITRRDEVVAYLVSRERMEAVAETLEILSRPEIVKQLQAYERGRLKLHPLEALGES